MTHDVAVRDNSIADVNERTLFITFARGVPMSQEEVKQFFTEQYGENCVQGIDMENRDGQALTICEVVLGLGCYHESRTQRLANSKIVVFIK